MPALSVAIGLPFMPIAPLRFWRDARRYAGKRLPNVGKTNIGTAEVKDGVKHLKQGLNEWNS